MLRKRVIGSVIVRDGIAVQSFSYRQWLPLGTPECLVENLDRWGADEIVVMCIDRSDQGPDLDLISRLGSLGLSTPLTYGGGVTTSIHAKDVVRSGAERLILDNVLCTNPDAVLDMAKAVGSQALIASLPLLEDSTGSIMHFHHLTRSKHPLSRDILRLFNSRSVSELLLIDVQNEGLCLGFNSNFVDFLSSFVDIPLLIFGGLAEPEHMRSLLQRRQVSGVILGNTLNYREHAIAHLKLDLLDLPIRRHTIQDTL